MLKLTRLLCTTHQKGMYSSERRVPTFSGKPTPTSWSKLWRPLCKSKGRLWGWEGRSHCLVGKFRGSQGANALWATGEVWSRTTMEARGSLLGLPPAQGLSLPGSPLPGFSPCLGSPCPGSLHFLYQATGYSQIQWPRYPCRIWGAKLGYSKYYLWGKGSGLGCTDAVS